jgi:hypothetical protein
MIFVVEKRSTLLTLAKDTVADRNPTAKNVDREYKFFLVAFFLSNEIKITGNVQPTRATKMVAIDDMADNFQNIVKYRIDRMEMNQFNPIMDQATDLVTKVL